MAKVEFKIGRINMRESGEREKKGENEERKRERELQYNPGGPQYFTI